MLSTLKNWLWGHPLLYPFILFALSAFFSIYAQDIKRFLHSWPRTKETALRISEESTRRRLELLKMLHNNSYNLLLYFGTKFIHLVFECFIWAVILTVFGAIRRKQFEPGVFVGLASGVFMGVCNTVRGVLVQLTRYDQSITKLEEEIRQLQLKSTNK